MPQFLGNILLYHLLIYGHKLKKEKRKEKKGMNGINLATDTCIKYIAWFSKKKKSKLLGSSSLSHPVNWDWNGSLFVKIVMYSNFKTTTSLTEFIVYEL